MLSPATVQDTAAQDDYAAATSPAVAMAALPTVVVTYLGVHAVVTRIFVHVVAMMPDTEAQVALVVGTDHVVCFVTFFLRKGPGVALAPYVGTVRLALGLVVPVVL